MDESGTQVILISIVIETMYDLVIVSQFKNESLIIREWIDHHLEVGVDHLYLIDNGSTDNYMDILDPYIQSRKVTLVIDPHRTQTKGADVLVFDAEKNQFVLEFQKNTHTQVVLSNKHYLKTIKQSAKWVMFIDQDEYMFSTRDTLKNVLRSVDESVTNIFVPWQIFGSSGHVQQPDSIRKSFTLRKPFDQLRCKAIEHGNIRGHGKSITRVSALKMLNIHQCGRTQYTTLAPDGTLIQNKQELLQWFHTYTPNPDTDLIFCNHYITMSKHYFRMHKCKRSPGCSNNLINGDNYWKTNNSHNTIVDTSILRACRDLEAEL